ncbi:hypothetical protein BD410DRAFT_94217 [Rickenella mellea]|uniref:Uncharacterized protein n=1 Tax=Rickenella mellea TaxID=50990 RepID=A0A4Y7QB09_9AGAM|nr:hypothetical protein BD410DRAFT_94217 [Rickenella mellea]
MQVCPDWLHGECIWENCVYLHERPSLVTVGENESTTPQVSNVRHSTTPAASGNTTSAVRQNRKPQVVESQIMNRQSSNVNQSRPSASVSTIKTAPAAHEAPLVPPGLLRSPSDSSASSSSAPLVPPGLLARPPVYCPPAPLEAPTKPRETLIITVLTSTRVTLGPGLEVLDVRTGFESSWILLGNLPPDVTERDIRSVAECYGEVHKIGLPGDDRRKRAKSIAAKIEFATPDEAAEAVENLHGVDVFSRTIIARLALFNERSKTGELRNCSVRIEFPAPGKIAYAGYATEGEAEWAIAALHKTTIRDQTISAAFYEGPHKLGPFMVKFEGLPADMDTQELQSYGIAEGCMLGHAAYQSLDEVLTKIRSILEDFGDLVSFELHSRIPRNGKIRAWARFVDPQSAEAAQRNFNGRKPSFLDNERVYLTQVHTVSYSISQELYVSLASDLDSFQRFTFLQSRVTLSIFDLHSRDSGSRVKIRMSGRGEDAIRRYKPLLEKMLNGEKLELDGVVVWDTFFTTPAGIAFIHAVSRVSKAYVRIDDRRDSITMYGSTAARQEARRRIIDHVYVLRARHSYSLQLSGRLISQLLTTHLTLLHEEIGSDNVVVDITKLRLIIRGNQKTFEHALRILARNAELGDEGQTDARLRQSTVDCPICFNEVVIPVTLECGHQACRTCMVRYIKSAADLQTFPLTCLGNDATCGKPVSLWTIRELLSKSDFKNLVDASFRQYVQARPREFRYCPSADCPQVYRGARGKVLQCPSCLVRICSTCNKEDHGGTKCKRPYEDDEELFQKWRNAHDVKSCPGCEAPIEKNEGCNHLTCSQCHTHICWVCLKTFARGFGIYEHMKVSHGGIGLED